MASNNKVQRLAQALPCLKDYVDLPECISPELQEDPLRVAVVGPAKTAVLNALVQDFLFFPLPNEVRMEMQQASTARLKYTYKTDGGHEVTEEVPLEACMEWKMLQRATYLKEVWNTLCNTHEHRLRRLVLYYPFNNRLQVPHLALTTEADNPPAHVVFTTTSTSKSKNSMVTVSGTTGTCNAVQPQEALMGYLAGVPSNASKYFDLVVRKMMTKAVLKAVQERQDNRDRSRQDLLMNIAKVQQYSQELQELCRRLQACVPSESAEARSSSTELESPLVQTEDSKPPQNEERRLLQQEESEPKAVESPRQPTVPAQPVEECIKPAQNEWCPKTSTWKPKATDWVPHASDWEPKAAEWKPHKSEWKPKDNDWRPHSSDWQPKQPDWQPKPEQKLGLKAMQWRPKESAWTPKVADWRPSASEVF